jgi:hypothetical protein
MIPKSEILRLLQTEGRQKDLAIASELPAEVDPDVEAHASILAELGVDPDALRGLGAALGDTPVIP